MPPFEPKEEILTEEERQTEQDASRLYKEAQLVAVKSDDGLNKVFLTDELVALDVVPSKEELLRLVKHLTNKHFFRTLQVGSAAAFSLRERNVAERLQRASQDEVIIYQSIENAGEAGTFSKKLKSSSMQPQQINKAIKLLQSADLIKQIKSVKNPSQKVFVLSHINPGDNVTGGTWHNEDAELDMTLIGITSDVVLRHIYEESWVVREVRVQKHMPKTPQQQVPNGVSDDKTSNGKRARQGDIEDAGDRPRKKQDTHETVEKQIPHEPGYTGYPTAETVLSYIRGLDFIKAPKVVEQDDVKRLLNVLELDGRIEKVGARGYRTIRGVKGISEAMGVSTGTRDKGEIDDEIENPGLLQVPCGRCPVFDLCEEGGPVNVTNCEYFPKWLEA